jgi:hypothetical protein
MVEKDGNWGGYSILSGGYEHTISGYDGLSTSHPTQKHKNAYTILEFL